MRGSAHVRIHQVHSLKSRRSAIASHRDAVIGSRVPVVLKYSVPRVRGAEMTESARFPRVSGAEKTESTRVLKAREAEMAESL